MPILLRLQVIYLAHLSSPPADRAIYRAIRRGGVRRILEIGIGRARRALRMIRLAAAYSPDQRIRYVGIDPFESGPGPSSDRLSLRQAYCQLRATGAQVRLLPGGPLAVLRQWANSLGPIDLVVLSAGWDPAQIAQAWFYVPRMLQARSLLFVEEGPPGAATSLRCLPMAEVERLACAARPARRAA